MAEPDISFLRTAAERRLWKVANRRPGDGPPDRKDTGGSKQGGNQFTPEQGLTPSPEVFPAEHR